MAGVPDDDEHEDGRLHKLCQAGSLCEVQQYVATISKIALEEELSKRKGIFGYTKLCSREIRLSWTTCWEWETLRMSTAELITVAPLHIAAADGHEDCYWRTTQT